jgi:hypothetical protein
VLGRELDIIRINGAAIAKWLGLALLATWHSLAKASAAIQESRLRELGIAVSQTEKPKTGPRS